ncbi:MULTISPECIES: hypothetical protein [Chitinophagaceae]
MASYSKKKGGKAVWLWILVSVVVLALILKAVGKLTTVTDKIKGWFTKKTV